MSLGGTEVEKWKERVGTEEVKGQKRKAGKLLQIHPGTDDTWTFLVWIQGEGGNGTDP